MKNNHTRKTTDSYRDKIKEHESILLTFNEVEETHAINAGWTKRIRIKIFDCPENDLKIKGWRKP